MEDFLSGLVSVVVITLIMIGVASKSGKKNGKIPININNNSVNRNVTAPSASIKVNKKYNHASMEDRNNDWLARELREEKRAQYRVSEMFQLKAEHKKDCQAEMIREFHKANCGSEGIDTAEGK